MTDTRTIFFIGKPGCGKGTQAKLLGEHTGWPVFGSGKEFRAISEEDTEVGRKVREEIDKGILSPPWFAMYLYQKALFSIPEGQSAIFDGFNRKVQESVLVVESLSWLSRPFNVVHIAISDEEVMKRIAVRKTEGARADDDFVPERLKEYYKYTQEAVDIFRSAHALIDVDGERPIDVIAADVRAKLGIA
ncbi:MAG TPA: nucleoside monophosphate kinase [Candidatus Paceibacterota bacterium]|nr:nucleoside monophosphate kinase [Candidatus Paceibacterota bacterium]